MSTLLHKLVRHYLKTLASPQYTPPIFFSLDFGEKTLTFSTFNDLIQKARYELSGKLLMLPIVGSGNSTVSFLKVDIKHTIKFKEETKENNLYFSVDSYNVKFNVTDHAHFEYENLFNGQKSLSDQIHKVANENWRELVADVSGSIEYGYGLVAKEYSKIVFNNIPIYEIFLKD